MTAMPAHLASFPLARVLQGRRQSLAAGGGQAGGGGGVGKGGMPTGTLHPEEMLLRIIGEVWAKKIVDDAQMDARGKPRVGMVKFVRDFYMRQVRAESPHRNPHRDPRRNPHRSALPLRSSRLVAHKR